MTVSHSGYTSCIFFPRLPVHPRPCRHQPPCPWHSLFSPSSLCSCSSTLCTCSATPCTSRPHSVDSGHWGRSLLHYPRPRLALHDLTRSTPAIGVGASFTTPGHPQGPPRGQITDHRATQSILSVLSVSCHPLSAVAPFLWATLVYSRVAFHGRVDIWSSRIPRLLRSAESARLFWCGWGGLLFYSKWRRFPSIFSKFPTTISRCPSLPGSALPVNSDDGTFIHQIVSLPLTETLNGSHNLRLLAERSL